MTKTIGKPENKIADIYAEAEAAEKAAEYLINEIQSNGYVSAAKDYAWYKPHWIRDSSWIAISLFRYAAFMQQSNPDTPKRAQEAGRKVLKFNMDAVNHYISNIKRAVRIDLSDPEFFLLKNHMPARVGPDCKPYKSISIDDTEEQDVMHSWQLQHDTIPLVLITLNEKMNTVGLNPKEVDFLRRNAKAMLEYIGKIYLTECASAWDMAQNNMYAYDLGVVCASLVAAEEFAEKGIIPLSKDGVRAISEGMYRGGPKAFPEKYFVDGDVVYGSRAPFLSLSDIGAGVDAACIYLFTDFLVWNNTLDKKIENATVLEMERRLFNGVMLPIRFQNDTYFMGGIWLPLGLAFADYYAKRGDVEKTHGIFDYLIGKYHDSYPKQGIVNPASPWNDQNNSYAGNGNKPIQDLAWSYAALIIASISALKAMEDKKADEILRKSLVIMLRDI